MPSFVSSRPFFVAPLVCGGVPLTALFVVAPWREHGVLLLSTALLFLAACFCASRWFSRPLPQNDMPTEECTEEKQQPAIQEGVAAIIKTVAGSAGRLGRLAEDHQARATTTTTAAAQVTESATIIASAVEEMNGSIQEIENQADGATRIVKTAVEKAALAEQAITGLAERTEQIVSIVSLISAVAQRTNLLALNASIEAARAGEQGRGFAVVAQEVKNLAKQVGEATDQIKGQIEDVRVSSHGSQGQIQEIRLIVQQINDVTLAIKNALQQQTLATREISSNAQATMTAANAVTTSVSHLLVTTEEIRRVGVDVGVQVQELQKSAG